MKMTADRLFDHLKKHYSPHPMLGPERTRIFTSTELSDEVGVPASNLAGTLATLKGQGRVVQVGCLAHNTFAFKLPSDPGEPGLVSEKDALLQIIVDDLKRDLLALYGQSALENVSLDNLLEEVKRRYPREIVVG